ncbi:putative Ovochymase-2 [Hypsibius exemplaris]|uniref:Ovochymase-2 n=1 Tax=Hypsibius exemplaris TaxID=2072580 RepID=A0A9X6RKC1_HYPEX|nr:putative Ovochymase-2 [Hypsibius exemplaris]
MFIPGRLYSWIFVSITLPLAGLSANASRRGSANDSTADGLTQSELAQLQKLLADMPPSVSPESSAQDRNVPNPIYVVPDQSAALRITPHQYPFVVSLQRVNGEHFCGGAILSSRHIVTAAHCVLDDDRRTTPASQIKVGVGLHNRKAATHNDYFHVKSVRPHPRYRGQPELISDIAILTLAQPIPLNLRGKTARRIELPASGSVNPRPGTTVLGIGWGKNSDDRDGLPQLLEGARLQVLNQSECGRRMKGPGSTMPWEKICVDSTKASACRGDSGGPLFKKVSSGRFHLVGLSSYGTQMCAAPGMASVFTRVSHYLGWIRKTMISSK